MLHPSHPALLDMHAAAAAPQDHRADAALARLWALRLLISAGGYEYLITEDGQVEDAWLAEWLGWDLRISAREAEQEMGDPPSIAPRRTRMLRRLHDLLQQAEVEHAGSLNSPVLQKSRHLAQVCKLPDAAAQILAFVALVLDSRHLLHRAARCLRPASEQEAAQMLAAVLQLDEQETLKAMAPEGPLVQTGLLTRHLKPDDLAARFGMDMHDLTEHLTDSDARIESWLAWALPESPGTALRNQDFGHIEQDVVLTQKILECTLDQHRQSGNVLLHGPAGAGKAELARLLARNLGITLYSVPATTLDGTPLTTPQRLRALKTTQKLLANARALVLFDGADDIGSLLAPTTDGRISASLSTLQWQGPLGLSGVHALLQATPTPTIWVAHDISAWPHALLSYFDQILAVPAPSSAQTLKWLNGHAGDLLSPTAAERLVDLPHVTPGLLVNALNRAREVLARGLQMPAEVLIESLIRGVLKLPQPR